MAIKPGKKPSGPSALGKSYLILYNVLQTIGWTYLLAISAIHFLNRGTLDTFWNEIKWTLIIFQNAAILEVVHAVVRLVPSGVFITLTQVYSRVFLVGGILLMTESAPVSPGLPLCILAWSVTEIIRYSYYVLNLINAVPDLLIYLRYTLFVVLYPLGVTGELLCMYYAQEEVGRTELWTYAMPNSYNFIFNYRLVIILTMLSYIPLFSMLYMHMFVLRKKVLGAAAADKVKVK